MEYEEKDIIVPLSRLLKDNAVEFIQTSVENVIPSEKVVKTSETDLTYDILVKLSYYLFGCESSGSDCLFQCRCFLVHQPLPQSSSTTRLSFV